MIEIRLAGDSKEIEEMIKSFEKHYDVKHQSLEYNRSNNPKYANRKTTRVYLSMGLK
ncbi:YvzF family protein [Priestia flexa]|nr:YvzF family protein [Priestia flexa]